MTIVQDKWSNRIFIPQFLCFV